jgi:hypothetical protein
MSGLLIGILSARTISGLLSGLGGWQTVYRVVAGVMVLAAVALWRALPAVPGRPGQRWGATVASLAGVARAFPRLRTRALLGGLTFAGASLVLSTMSLLPTGPPSVWTTRRSVSSVWSESRVRCWLTSSAGQSTVDGVDR